MTKIKILGISSGKRSKYDCARDDPVSLKYLRIALDEAKKQGASTKLIDLRELDINPCKECYSTNPAQCRFNEKKYQCDCYRFKEDVIYSDNQNKFLTLEQAYNEFSKEDFLKYLNNKEYHTKKDDMYIVYKEMLEADAIIFATSTAFYSRPALLQNMISRLCALDGGVVELWGDGKNLQNSIKYSKKPNATYKQRLYGKTCAFINCSKEGDSVSPDLMKACTMMGMRIIPLGVAYRVNWYNDATHSSESKKSLSDKYTLSLLKHLGKKIVEESKNSNKKYGKLSSTV